MTRIKQNLTMDLDSEQIQMLKKILDYQIKSYNDCGIYKKMSVSLKEQPKYDDEFIDHYKMFCFLLSLQKKVITFTRLDNHKDFSVYKIINELQFIDDIAFIGINPSVLNLILKNKYEYKSLDNLYDCLDLDYLDKMKIEIY